MTPVSDRNGIHFGSLLRRHRLAAGLSQEELAERAGLSADGVSALETGRRAAPRPYTVRALADALALAEDDRLTLIAAAQAPLAPDTCRPQARRPPRANGVGSCHRRGRRRASSAASARSRRSPSPCDPAAPVC